MTTLHVPPLVRDGMDEAVQAVWSARKIVLACHINPDGDTLGCLIALGLGLERLGKEVVLLSADGVPANLRFLPGTERVERATERRDFDLGIGLDAGELARVGASRAALESAPLLIDIDHHVTAGRFGQIQLLDAEAAATGEIVYDLLLALGIDLTPEIAQNLLCALLTDTGSFRFTNVTPRTMAIGGALIGHGAQPDPIAEAVYENKPYAAQQLLGRALSGMGRSDDGRIVWAVVTRADFLAVGVGDEATEGIVQALRSVEGSQVAVLLREMESGRLRVSLRARPPHDVSQVASRFGGGGHRLAAGCSIDGPPDVALATLRAAVESVL